MRGQTAEEHRCHRASSAAGSTFCASNANEAAAWLRPPGAARSIADHNIPSEQVCLQNPVDLAVSQRCSCSWSSIQRSCCCAPSAGADCDENKQEVENPKTRPAVRQMGLHWNRN